MALAPPFLGPGFRLGARWNRLGEAVKTRKKRKKTGKKWARYDLRSVNKERTGGINWHPPLIRHQHGTVASDLSHGAACHSPMLHVKKQARKSQALYNLVNFDMVEKFVEDPEKEYGEQPSLRP